MKGEAFVALVGLALLAASAVFPPPGGPKRKEDR